MHDVRIAFPWAQSEYRSIKGCQDSPDQQITGQQTRIRVGTKKQEITFHFDLKIALFVYALERNDLRDMDNVLCAVKISSKTCGQK